MEQNDSSISRFSEGILFPGWEIKVEVSTANLQLAITRVSPTVPQQILFIVSFSLPGAASRTEQFSGTTIVSHRPALCCLGMLLLLPTASLEKDAHPNAHPSGAVTGAGGLSLNAISHPQLSRGKRSISSVLTPVVLKLPATPDTASSWHRIFQICGRGLQTLAWT